MSENLDLRVFRKTTVNYLLTFVKNGAGRDITGWTVYFTVKENMGDADVDAKIRYDITSHEDAVNGKTVIHLTQDDTDRAADLWYDVTYRDTENNVGVLFYGRILFAEKATQRA